MTDPMLTKLISENNPQKIEKYVKNYLPDNPYNLERIYRQLESFSTTLNQIIKSDDVQTKKFSILSSKKKRMQQKQVKNSEIVMRRYKSHKQIKMIAQNTKVEDYFQRNKQQNITKRQQSLIRNLKEKGIRSSTDDLFLGKKVLADKQAKIIKPLQRNKNVVFKQNTSVMNCIKRFNLNKRFYSNTIEDAEVDAQKYYDKQMKQFLDRRHKSLSKIHSKQQFEMQQKLENSIKYSNIESKLFSKTQRTLPLETILKLSGSSLRIYQEKLKSHQYLKSKQSQLGNIMKYCTDTLEQIPDYRPKSLLSQNIKFKRMHQKTDEIVDKMTSLYKQFQYEKKQLPNHKLQINQLATLHNKGNEIEKYTLSYLKSIKTRTRNQMILTNRNDLIKNQAKFRNLVAERNF